MVETLKHTEGAEQIKIDINCAINFKLLSDEKRLIVILNNLIGNAIKYRDDKKKKLFIEVSAQNKESGYEISITDNGLGIKQEFLSKIFDMFYRASESSTGSGLGLYIVKETVEKLKGKIEVQSEFGVGTSFTLLLPK